MNKDIPEGYEDVVNGTAASDLPEGYEEVDFPSGNFPEPTSQAQPPEAQPAPPVAGNEQPAQPRQEMEKGFIQSLAEDVADNPIVRESQAWSPLNLAAQGLGVVGAGAAGVAQGFGGIAQTGRVAKDIVTKGDSDEIPMNRSSNFQQPLTDIGTLGASVKKVAYMMGESSPTILAGFMGELAGPWTAVSTAAATSAAQTFGPEYAEFRQQGLTHQEAVRLSATRSGIAGVAGGLGMKWFRSIPMENAAANAATQMLAVQPALNVAEQWASNPLVYQQTPLGKNQPWYSGGLDAYLGGVVIGGTMMAAAKVVGRPKVTKDTTPPVTDEEVRGADNKPEYTGKEEPPEGYDEVGPTVEDRIRDRMAKEEEQGPSWIKDLNDTELEAVLQEQGIGQDVRDVVEAELNRRSGVEEEPGVTVPQNPQTYGEMSFEQLKQARDAAAPDGRQAIEEEMLRRMKDFETEQSLRDVPEFLRDMALARIKDWQNPKEVGVIPDIIQEPNQGRIEKGPTEAANDPTGYDAAINQSTASREGYGETFLKNNLEQEDGASARFEEIFNKYKERAGKNPLSETEFRKKIMDQGYRVSKIAGSQRILGVKLRSKPAVTEDGNVSTFPGAERGNGTAETPAPSELPAGISFKGGVNKARQGNFTVHDAKGKQIGWAYARPYGHPDAKQIQIGQIHIDEGYQRKGIGTALQRHIEQKMGAKAVPDVFMSNAEYSRWKKNDPAAVEGRYSQVGTSWQEKPFFPRGPFEAMSDRIEGTVRAMDSDRIQPVMESGDVVDTSMLNGFLERARQLVRKEKKERQVAYAGMDNLPRYMVMQPDGTAKLLNASDMEGELALRGNMAEPSNVQVADVRNIDARNIMADRTDLPREANDPRVITTGRMSLRQLAIAMDAAEGGDGAAYRQMIEAGVRIAPSYNSSFVVVNPSGLTPSASIPFAGSGRSGHSFFLNRPGAIVGLFHGLGRKAFDYTKLQNIQLKDHLTSLDMDRIGELPAQYQKEYAKAALWFDYKRIAQLAEKGARIEPRLDQNGALAENELVMFKAFPKEIVTEAYGGVGRDDTQLLQVGQHELKAPQGQLFVTWDNSGNLSKARRDMTNAVIDALREIKPELDYLTRRLGARKTPDYFIQEAEGPFPMAGNASPAAFWADGAIVFHMPFFWKANSLAGDLRAQITQVALHELGHVITLRSWTNLSSAKRSEVYAAYKRELLSWTMTKDYSSFEGIFKEQGHNQTYHLKFAEWLAEQFRRYASVDKGFNDNIDAFLVEQAKSRDALYQWYVDRDNPGMAQQRFTPSYEFHALMQHMEGQAERGQSLIDMRNREIFEHAPDYSIPDNTRLADAVQDVYGVLAEMKQTIGTLDDIDYRIDTTIPDLESAAKNGIEFGNFDNKNTIKLMAGSLAWYGDSGVRTAIAGRTAIHETWHAVERIIGQRGLDKLTQLADKLGVFSAADDARYRRSLEPALKRMGYEGEALRSMLQKRIDREKRAFLAEEVRNGLILDGTPKTLMDQVQAFIKKIFDVVTNHRFASAEDILTSLKRGELVRRYNEQIRRNKNVLPFDEKMRISSKVHDLGDGLYGTVSHEASTDTTIYNVRGRAGEPVAYLKVINKKDGPYVDMIEVQDQGAIRRMVREGKGRISDRLLDWAEGYMGQKFRAPQEFTKAGYKMMLSRDPARVYGYTLINGLYMSPKYVRDHYIRVQEDLKGAREDGVDRGTIHFLEKSVATWKQRFENIPKEVYDSRDLDKQWSLKEFELAQWEKERQRGTDETMQEIMGRVPSEDPFERISRVMDQVEAEYSKRVTGYDWGEPTQPETQNLRNMIQLVTNPQARKQLHLQAMYQDKMWGINKRWWTIHQLAWKHPTITWIRDYLTANENQVQRSMQWVARAGERARGWEQLHENQRNGLTKLLFWATNMEYRTAAEKKAKLLRHPTEQEVLAQAQKLGIGTATVGMSGLVPRLVDPKVGSIAGDFNDFLTQMHQIFNAQIDKQFAGNPRQNAAAKAKLAADMAAMKKRPYFPMARFGKYTVTVRDTSGKVEHFEAFESVKSQLRAKAEMERQFPNSEVKATLMPEQYGDYQGLPKPLLDRIIAQLPKTSAEQIEWLQKFAHQAAPEHSFRKKWLEREGTPGYSLDGIRAYADYFRRGSRYLARLEFRDTILDTIKRGDQEVKSLAYGNERAHMLDMVRNHYDWIQKPGKDVINFKSFVTNWQLGSSFAAAMLNGTQVPLFTVPYLHSLFGNAALGKVAKDTGSAMKRTFGHLDPKMNPQFLEGHAEAIAQGVIDTTQAAELGGYADSNNLTRSFAGTSNQKFWRGAMTANMYAFGKVERFNREWTFRSAFELALQNPNNKHVKDVTKWYNIEILDLVSRRPGMDMDAAAAFYVAREAVNRTQGVYQSWDRPRFMRHPIASAASIFMSYLQQTLFMMNNNPGKMKTLILFGALYGMQGLPFSQDISDTIAMFSKRLFGKDFNPHDWARKKIVELTEGTAFDEIGPDLFMHGFARFAGGLGLFPESMGTPRFDASLNGSMGSIIPGLQQFTKGIGRRDDLTKVFGDTVKDVAGAGFGPFWTIFQKANEAPNAAGDWKRWEAVLPRAAKAMSKSFRYAYTGKETDKNGATIAKFDLTDPDDRATLVTQFLGFTPYKISRHYDIMNEYYDRESFYKMQKTDLMVQFKMAVDSKDPKLMQDVGEEIDRFNKTLAADGMGSMAVTKEKLKASIKAKERIKSMTEMGLPAQKSYIPLRKDVDRMFPAPRNQRLIE